MKSTVQRQGFTLVEVMVTLTLSILVCATLTMVYMWSFNNVMLCAKKNRSQVAAVTSSVRIMECVRNASNMVVNGSWVKLNFFNGITATLAYTNSPDCVEGRALGLFRAGRNPIWLVRNGVTPIMPADGAGNSQVIFAADESGKLLYVNYRVSQPADNGGREINDANYATNVRFAINMRNSN